MKINIAFIKMKILLYQCKLKLKKNNVKTNLQHKWIYTKYSTLSQETKFYNSKVSREYNINKMYFLMKITFYLYDNTSARLYIDKLKQMQSFIIFLIVVDNKKRIYYRTWRKLINVLSIIKYPSKFWLLQWPL